MYDNNTTKFLGIKGAVAKKVINNDECIEVYLQIKRPKPKQCPHCGSKTLHYHDKRVQKIKDVPYNLKHVFLIVDRIRYKCPCCKRKFQVEPDFVMKGCQVTQRLFLYVLKQFGEMRSARDIAKECGISITSVFRFIERLHFRRKELPEVLCIDEFKGDSGGEKFQVNLADGKNHKIIDILHSRKEAFLFEYFSKIPKEERNKVKHFVSDMSKSFQRVRERFFPNSIHVIDRYHFIRQVLWSLERVRKREQGKMSYKERLYFKRSKSLLSKNATHLEDLEKLKLADMLERNEDVRHAYYLKEGYYKYVLIQDNSEGARKALDLWLEEAEAHGDREWRACIRAFENWKEEILNSFDVPWRDGYVEGTHNRIKTLKWISFGMPNFEHFRTKILSNMP